MFKESYFLHAVGYPAGSEIKIIRNIETNLAVTIFAFNSYWDFFVCVPRGSLEFGRVLFSKGEKL